jgi:hypothetical protein
MSGPRTMTHAPQPAATTRTPARQRRPMPSSQPAFPHRDAIERSFGPLHTLSDLRVHVGDAAGRQAGSLGAAGLTVGDRVVFHQSPSLRLAAHEAAHVVQQRAGWRPPGGWGQVGDPFEQHANRVADQVVAGQPAGALLPAPTTSTPATAVQAQTYGSSPTGVRDPNAYIPVADLIRYIQAVERAYPGDSATDVLTRIRMQYYSGLAFDQLIPRANTHDYYPSYSPYGSGGTSVRRRMSKFLLDREDADAHVHLTARADENAVGDNPSPYIVMPSGEEIDLGHLLLGMDALVHPPTSVPYTTYGVPNIDPSSWVADIGIAAVWTTQHDESGSPPSDAPVQPTTSSLTAYWNASAPVQDLLSDVDSFGVRAEFRPASGGNLSDALRAYYIGSASAAPKIHRRFRTFCAANGLGYTVSGSTVTWAPGLAATLTPRVDAFNDLYAAGTWGTAWGVVAGPSHRAWPHTPTVIDLFLTWVKSNLEAEIAAHP